jgi:hypothetical protein
MRLVMTSLQTIGEAPARPAKSLHIKRFRDDDRPLFADESHCDARLQRRRQNKSLAIHSSGINRQANQDLIEFGIAIGAPNERVLSRLVRRFWESAPITKLSINDVPTLVNSLCL